ncbi:GNAT family N-acetyltransferase [Calidithermus roseus]|uniref:Acetyltransferase (GNAT) family protein n=1 Tax=Calidithermus roseus TaxID=1644118 RepID=A0A399EGU5_9DEIN|nr:GNAT family N-acetyltransferase [Calidithermus roseus]RIH83847.1 Acetyltransferase (GNAT) family protein [Calidithermus roseus]
MYAFRRATPEDAERIAHRRRMFVDMGHPDEAMEEAIQAFIPWVRRSLESGYYTGFLAAQGEGVVAGAGLMFLEWPPRADSLQTLRGYLLNVSTEPEHRGRGLAKAPVQQALEHCQERGVHSVALHASEAGRRIYEGLGFRASNEMVWRAR